MSIFNSIYQAIFETSFNYNGIGGSTSSTGVAYDLLSEGEIELVGGLNGIFLNRTPLSNKSELLKVQSNITIAFAVDNRNLTIYGASGSAENVPVIVLGGAKTGNITSQNGATLTVSNFFDDTIVQINLKLAVIFTKFSDRH